MAHTHHGAHARGTGAPWSAHCGTRMRRKQTHPEQTHAQRVGAPWAHARTGRRRTLGARTAAHARTGNRHTLGTHITAHACGGNRRTRGTHREPTGTHRQRADYGMGATHAPRSRRRQSCRTQSGRRSARMRTCNTRARARVGTENFSHSELPHAENPGTNDFMGEFYQMCKEEMGPHPKTSLLLHPSRRRHTKKIPPSSVQYKHTVPTEHRQLNPAPNKSIQCDQDGLVPRRQS